VSSRRLDPGPPPERTYWQLVPRRNLRRALFLVLALLGVVAIKRAGGFSFGGLFDGGHHAPAQSGQGGFRHLEVKR
jgi:hypothetical protein